MQHSVTTAIAVALVFSGAGLRAQAPVASAAGIPVTSAATIQGQKDGARASVAGVRWGSAAATFFLTPMVGGVGSILYAQTKSAAVPARVPFPTGFANATDSTAYAKDYRAAYRASYLPRRKRTIITSALITTAVFFVGILALSDS